ncbi:MAG: hypothetical protein ABI867_44255 [Kofleriaceae bacterium]
MIETTTATAPPSTVVESRLGLGLGTSVRALRIHGVVTRPLLEASTPDLVLGDIARDAPATRSLMIANRGNAPASVTLSADAPLIVAPAELVLAPNATRRITVTVERAAPAGLFSAEIRGVLANCEAEPLAITARGTIVD